MTTKTASKKLALQLVESLPTGQKLLFNPWMEECTDDVKSNGPAAKIERLVAHLSCDPKFIILGEAPGFQGCRHSGVAFTSERLLLDGAIPRIDPPKGRLTHRKLPFSEPSATIMWRTLRQFGIAEQTVLWNALQMHPHKEGDVRSNRPPRWNELALGMPAIRILVNAFPRAKVVAVGRKAERLLYDMGIPVNCAVRHPANGGARDFEEGICKLVVSSIDQS